MSFGNLTTISEGFGARTGTAGIVTAGFGTGGVFTPLHLTVISLGFGIRSGSPGVVTMGFGTGSTPPPPSTGRHYNIGMFGMGSFSVTGWE